MNYSSFKRDSIVPTNFDEINEILNSLKNKAVKIVEGKYIHNGNAYYEVGLRFFKLTCKHKGKVATFVFDMALGDKHEANRQCSSGMDSFIRLKKSLGKELIDLIPKLVKEDDLLLGKNIDPFSTSPLLYCNEQYNNKETQAYGYDMNSAYAYAMLGDIPDTRELKTVKIRSWNKGIVEDNQIGFDSVGEIVPTGQWAMFRFPRLKSPFGGFVKKYYTIKSTTTNKEEKQKAKDILCHSVGYFQRVNPFIRAVIVSRANQIIRSLMDEDTLYCNTDSIVSKRPRDDLKLGTNVGEWKLEHQGKFRYKDMSYQWNNEPPAYRGIPKAWFPKNYNILEDELPDMGNMYEFNSRKKQLERSKV